MKYFCFLLIILVSNSSVFSQQKYPVAEELLPLLDKIPSLDISLQKASKNSSCGEVCCTENAISDLLKSLDRITQNRLKEPELKEEKKLGLNNLNVGDIKNLDVKDASTALAKSTVKVLDGNPTLLSGKTIKALDTNPAMLGNKKIKVLDTNPAMLSKTGGTKALDTNPAMLDNSNKNKKNTNTNTTNYPIENNDVNAELIRLLKDESTFRVNINTQWESLQKEFNVEIEKFNDEKKNIENNNTKSASDKAKQTKEVNKKTSDYYANFMKNKANVLLSNHKQEITSRYTYLDISIKQNNYGIDQKQLYKSINDAQDTMLELIEALGVYAADCITAGCELNKQTK